MTKRQQQLVWSERPTRELIRLTWPIAVSTLSYSVMTMVDTAFVARLGAASLAGVGLGATILFALMCFPLGLLRAVKILVSQSRGSGRRDGDQYLVVALVSAVSLGVIVIGGAFVVLPVVRWVAASPEAATSAASYLWVRGLGAPLLFCYVAIREWRYGEADSRTPMIAAIVSNVGNVVFDYVLIVVLDHGVVGAAIATVLAIALELAVLWYAMSSQLRGIVRRCLRLGPLRRYLSELWRIGIPTGVQFLLEIGSFAALSMMLAGLGDEELAAHQIVLNLTHFSFLPAYALAEASGVMSGEAAGAGRQDLVVPVALRSMSLASAYTALCTVVFVVFAEPMAHAFVGAGGGLSTTVAVLHVAAVFLIADGANVVARGVLRGVGDVRFAACIGIATAWLTTPPLTWILGYHFGLGAVGGWIGLSVEIFIGAVLLWRRILSKRWQAVATEMVSGSGP